MSLGVAKTTAKSRLVFEFAINLKGSPFQFRVARRVMETYTSVRQIVGMFRRVQSLVARAVGIPGVGVSNVYAG